MSIRKNSSLVEQNIYYFLWLKEAGLKDNAFSVRIPDTILIKGPQITAWYFTKQIPQSSTAESPSDPINAATPQSTPRFDPLTNTPIPPTATTTSSCDVRILKKKACNMSAAHILESFTSRASKSGIIAQLLTLDNGIVYMTETTLKDYLFNKLPHQVAYTDSTAILQAFIEPPGESNSMIEAIWSPTTSIFTRRVNNKKLATTSFEPYERAVTFDGAEVFSTQVCVKGKQVSNKILTQCENIVARVAQATFDKSRITKITLYFKPDAANRLHFLFCTDVHILVNNNSKKQYTVPTTTTTTPLNMPAAAAAASQTLISQKITIPSSTSITSNTSNPNHSKSKTISQTTSAIHNNINTAAVSFKAPYNLRNTYSMSSFKPAQLTNDTECLRCEKLCQQADIASLPFRLLIQYLKQADAKGMYNLSNASLPPKKRQSIEVMFAAAAAASPSSALHSHSIAAVKPGNHHSSQMNSHKYSDEDEIKQYVHMQPPPREPIMKKLFPKMSKNQYQDFLREGQFDSMVIPVCFDCYFELAGQSRLSGAPERVSQPKHVQSQFESIQSGSMRQTPVTPAFTKQPFASQNSISPIQSTTNIQITPNYETTTTTTAINQSKQKQKKIQQQQRLQQQQHAQEQQQKRVSLVTSALFTQSIQKMSLEKDIVLASYSVSPKHFDRSTLERRLELLSEAPCSQQQQQQQQQQHQNQILFNSNRKIHTANPTTNRRNPREEDPLLRIHLRTEPENNDLESNAPILTTPQQSPQQLLTLSAYSKYLSPSSKQVKRIIESATVISDGLQHRGDFDSDVETKHSSSNKTNHRNWIRTDENVKSSAESDYEPSHHPPKQLQYQQSSQSHLNNQNPKQHSEGGEDDQFSQSMYSSNGFVELRKSNFGYLSSSKKPNMNTYSNANHYRNSFNNNSAAISNTNRSEVSPTAVTGDLKYFPASQQTKRIKHSSSSQRFQKTLNVIAEPQSPSHSQFKQITNNKPGVVPQYIPLHQLFASSLLEQQQQQEQQIIVNQSASSQQLIPAADGGVSSTIGQDGQLNNSQKVTSPLGNLFKKQSELKPFKFTTPAEAAATANTFNIRRVHTASTMLTANSFKYKKASPYLQTLCVPSPQCVTSPKGPSPQQNKLSQQNQQGVPPSATLSTTNRKKDNSEKTPRGTVAAAAPWFSSMNSSKLADMKKITLQSYQV